MEKTGLPGKVWFCLSDLSNLIWQISRAEIEGNVESPQVLSRLTVVAVISRFSSAGNF
jgi:hypothetical protein